VQLIGDWLYVANTDNIMKFPYSPGQTSISAPGTLFTDLPGTIEHHWTKALLASPDGSKLYVGVGSNSNIGENGLDVEYRRAAVLEVDVAGAAAGSSLRGSATRPGCSGNRRPARCGPSPTSATRSVPTWCRTI